MPPQSFKDIASLFLLPLCFAEKKKEVRKEQKIKAKFHTGKYGNPFMQDDKGYVYHRGGAQNGAKSHWQCKQKYMTKCTARCVTNGSYIEKFTGDQHNHVAPLLLEQ